MATADGHGKAHDHAGEHTPGQMNIASQRALFQGFLKTAEWSSVLLAMLLGLLVTAFAVGFGWWAGLAVWAIVGVAAGLLMSMGSAWWATLIASTLILAVGGGVVLGVGAFL